MSKIKKPDKKTVIKNATLEHGKLPPQALELEEAVLGALMLEKDALTTVIDVLKPQCFYKESHQLIFQSILSLFEKSDPIDILTVTNQLKRDGNLESIGGAYYISQLTDKVSSSANIEYHGRIILQKYLQRELISISSEIITDAYEDTTDVFDLLDQAERSLFGVTDGNLRKDVANIRQVIGDSIKQIEIARQHEGGLTGVPSGFLELDRTTGGWQKSDLIIIASRPGMGKTSFVLSMARNMAVEYGKPVAIFSLEMSSIQLANRLISSETELPGEKLRKGQLEDFEWEQLNSKISALSDSPIYIDDTPALSIFELRAKARRLKAQHNIDLIIVDYLQLMTAGSEHKGNREQEISNISRSLKSIAKEINIPIIALSQLSRAVETRGGSKKPMLSDLRESGAIEQDADMVMFIYRPEYYDLSEDEDGNSTKGKAELIIAKNRSGALKNINLRFKPQLAKFVDLDGSFDFVSGGEDFDGSHNTIIKGSRMDEVDEEPF